MSKVIEISKPTPQKHEVTKQEVLDAIKFFHVSGMIDNLCGDEEYYVKILLRKVANIYNIQLTINEGELL